MRSGQKRAWADIIGAVQETLNYWKQLSHIMKYFRKEEDANARLPKNFIGGFLEVSFQYPLQPYIMLTSFVCREGIRPSSFTFVRYMKRHGVHSKKPSKQRHCNATFTPYRTVPGVSLRLHVVLSKRISSFSELLCYNVTCFHQVVQTFFQGFEDCSFLFGRGKLVGMT